MGAAIVALFGLAAFHNLMASAQYDLEKVELELDLEQARLVDIGFQIQQLNSPRKVEQLARGALGRIDPADPVALDVEAALLADVNTAHPPPRPSGDDNRCGYGSRNHGTATQDNAPDLTQVYEET